MKNHKNKIITGFIIILILFCAYWWGGNSPGLQGSVSHQTNSNIIESPSPIPLPTSDSIKNTDKTVDDTSSENIPRSVSDNTIPQSTDVPHIVTSEKSDSLKTHTENKPDTDISCSEPTAAPLPIEPENVKISDNQLTCTLSVRCDTILNNISWLNPEKIEILPKNGVIYPEQTVTFYEGESVFNILVREMKRSKIHLEFENTPIYNSAYIEGIGNIYEFDCGELSGWMYKVNDWFPNYGCSRYQLKKGDKVEWVYTCDLGADVGDNYSSRNGR